MSFGKRALGVAAGITMTLSGVILLVGLIADRWLASFWVAGVLVLIAEAGLWLLPRRESAEHDPRNSTRNLTGWIGIAAVTSGVIFVCTWLLGDTPLVGGGGFVLVIVGLDLCYAAWWAALKKSSRMWGVGPSRTPRWTDGNYSRDDC